MDIQRFIRRCKKIFHVETAVVSGFLNDFARQSWYGKMNSVFTGVSSMKEVQKFACGKGVFLVT